MNGVAASTGSVAREFFHILLEYRDESWDWIFDDGLFKQRRRLFGTSIDAALAFRARLGTQSFNTATSMGRLTLNMLLSFAQFEREVIAERIRDKIAASKRRGLWMGGLVPLGYDADGRTLKINEAEAQTIRRLYNLYEIHGTVRQVKDVADNLQLRTKRRETTAGKQTGGGRFDRWHIHHILTNPIYAGRIKHKTLIHDGQHDAIIEPDRWDRIQQVLQDGAAKCWAGKTAKQHSLLCGKIYDETGDRLTPSHGKTRAGVRLRYYVSHRLIKNSGTASKDGWRLPAEELETKVAKVMAKHLKAPGFIGKIAPNLTAAAIANVRDSLHKVGAKKDPRSCLQFVERIDLKLGAMTVTLDATRIASLIGCDQTGFEPDTLTITTPFQLRKRGVESKLIFADAPSQRDETLISNIAKAHHWFEQIKSGKTFSQIAETDQTSKRRIQQVIDLAFLAPDIVRDVLNGMQPFGFTSDWCLRHAIPTNWDEQRALIATL